MKPIKLLRLSIINFLLIAMVAFLTYTPQLTLAQINYKAKVQTISGNQLKGQIIRITKDSLFLKTGKEPEQLIVAGSEIRTLRIRKIGDVGKGFLIGAATGIILGGAIGYVSYTPPECSSGWCFDFGPEYDAYGGAFLGFVAGSIIGTAVGSSGKVFTVKGENRILEEAMIYINTNSSYPKK